MVCRFHHPPHLKSYYLRPVAEPSVLTDLSQITKTLENYRAWFKNIKPTNKTFSQNDLDFMISLITKIILTTKGRGLDFLLENISHYLHNNWLSERQILDLATVLALTPRSWGLATLQQKLKNKKTKPQLKRLLVATLTHYLTNEQSQPYLEELLQPCPLNRDLQHKNWTAAISLISNQIHLSTAQYQFYIQRCFAGLETADFIEKIDAFNLLQSLLRRANQKKIILGAKIVEQLFTYLPKTNLPDEYWLACAFSQNPKYLQVALEKTKSLQLENEDDFLPLYAFWQAGHLPLQQLNQNQLLILISQAQELDEPEQAALLEALPTLDSEFYHPVFQATQRFALVPNAQQAQFLYRFWTGGKADLTDFVATKSSSKFYTDSKVLHEDTKELAKLTLQNRQGLLQKQDFYSYLNTFFPNLKEHNADFYSPKSNKKEVSFQPDVLALCPPVIEILTSKIKQGNLNLNEKGIQQLAEILARVQPPATFRKLLVEYPTLFEPPIPITANLYNHLKKNPFLLEEFAQKSLADFTNQRFTAGNAVFWDVFSGTFTEKEVISPLLQEKICDFGVELHRRSPADFANLYQVWQCFADQRILKIMGGWSNFLSKHDQCNLILTIAKIKEKKTKKSSIKKQW